jgi:methionyl aminopeptidase
MFKKKPSIQIKSAEQITMMRQAGLVVARVLATVRDAADIGVTTAQLNDIAHDIMKQEGATPSFLGYHGFPAVVCTSVNHEVVHGIPSDRALADGDVISVDCGAIVDGWHGDAAITIFVGDVAPEIRALSEATEASLWAGIAQMRAGNHLSDIGHAIEQTINAAGSYGIVRDFVGHGIGTEMHMHPPVPNHGAPGRGPLLEVGMALAIEPMATIGSEEVQVLDDGWTVVTDDDSWACHWEHTVAITPEGPWVLTALEDVRL